jgi:hypothetical protein
MRGAEAGHLLQGDADLGFFVGLAEEVVDLLSLETLEGTYARRLFTPRKLKSRPRLTQRRTLRYISVDWTGDVLAVDTQASGPS